MTEPKTLLQLWLNKSGENEDQLTVAEKALLRADASGGYVDFLLNATRQVREDDFIANNWTQDHSIKSILLMWMLTDQQAVDKLPSSGLHLYSIRIRGPFALQYSKISYPLYFSFCRIDSPILLLDAKCVKLVFVDCQLYSLDMHFTSFEKDIELMNCTFTGSNPLSLVQEEQFAVSMQGCIVRRNLKIDAVDIKHGIDFLDAEIGGELRITGISTPEARAANDNNLIIFLRLQSVSVAKRFFLAGFKVHGTLRIDLKSCQCRTFINDKTSWPEADYLWVDQFRYSAIKPYGRISLNVIDYLGWLHLQKSEPFFSQPWQQLAQTFREHGDEEAAKKVLIDKEKRQIDFGKLTFLSKLWKQFSGIIIGYGYRPGRALFIMLCFVVVGSLSFSCLHSEKILQPGYSNVSKEIVEADFCAPIFAVDLFVPFLDLNQDKHWSVASSFDMQVDGKVVKQYVSCYWLFHLLYVGYIGAGWFFSTLLAASLTGLWKKD